MNGYNNQSKYKPHAATAVAAMPYEIPYNAEMERAVLGALLIEKQAYRRVEELLRPESFFEERNQLVYAAVQSVAEGSGHVDMLNVTQQLLRMGKLDAAGGPIYVAELAQGVGLAEHVESHAAVVAELAVKRALMTMGSDLSAHASQGTSDSGELLVDAQNRIDEIGRSLTSSEAVSLGEVWAESCERLRQASLTPGYISGLLTGFTALDAITSGWQRQDLIIIAGRPSMGKTAFVLSMVRNIAVDGKVPVGIFSLEMSRIQLADRLMMSQCDIPGERLRDGSITPEEWPYIMRRMEPCWSAPLYIDDTGGLSVTEFRIRARKMVRERGVRLLVVDYLQLMTAAGGRTQSREQEVSAISRTLKTVAKELDVPVVALSQLNRAVESRTAEGRRPQLSDLRESGAIEQDADLVCFLHRPEYYNIMEDERGNDMRGVAQLIIAKHRNGAVGDVRMLFRSELARFENAPVVVEKPAG